MKPFYLFITNPNFDFSLFNFYYFKGSLLNLRVIKSYTLQHYKIPVTSSIRMIIGFQVYEKKILQECLNYENEILYIKNGNFLYSFDTTKKFLNSITSLNINTLITNNLTNVFFKFFKWTYLRLLLIIRIKLYV